jgi:hypothetical protein
MGGRRDLGLAEFVAGLALLPDMVSLPWAYEQTTR